VVHAETSGYPQQIIRDRYRLERMVGRGSMATLWVARDLRVGDTVAVKLLTSLTDGEARQRFRREGETSTRLRSKFVVRLFDYGETAEGVPFLVMELLHGLTLEAYARRVGRMPMRHAVRFGVQIARGIAHAHRRGIIHRNLRPTNIFLHSEASASPDDVILKILDFGVAKIQDVSPDSAMPVASRPNNVIGTPLFMAPEQLLGLRPVDHRVDLYAIGILVFTLLTGKPAFEADSTYDLAGAILNKPLIKPTSLAPDLPHALDAWFERACARDTENRFSRANDLAMGLHQAAGFEGPLDIHLEPGHAPVLPDTVVLELDVSSEIPTQRWIPPAED
jgi:eukaryotic-like serine/threonine-protein kinase